MSTPIHKYTLDGKYIRSYESVIVGAKSVDRTSCSIIASIKDGYACGHFLWSYEKTSTVISPTPRKRPTHKYNLDGEYICSYESRYKAALSVDVLTCNITTSVKLEIASGGFLWSNKKCKRIKPASLSNMIVPIHQYDKDTGVYIKTFENQSAARVEVSPKSKLALNCFVDCHSIYGFRWSVQRYDILPSRRSRLRCPHCGFFGYGSYMVERHFDNCRKNNE